MRALVIVLTLLAGGLGALCVPSAHAQVPVTVERGASSDRVARWSERVPARPEQAIEHARQQHPVGTVVVEDLTVLAEIEGALAIARAAAARLEEGVALTALSQASRLARAHLDVPGMAAWYAEVQLAIALTASQAGLDSLGDAALSRAASVDPDRGVLAAEARPEVVAHALSAYRAVATAARGRFEVTANVAGAVVYLDDRRLGTLPRQVETHVGPHVLRVEAPGHLAWARLVSVLEGDRPPLAVTLSPGRALQGARRALDAARSGRTDRVAQHLATLPALSLSLLYPSRTRDRALELVCRAEGCETARRREAGRVLAGSVPLSEGLRWLDARTTRPVARIAPWWERWELWTGIGLGVLVGIGTAVLLAQPQGEAPLVVVVDPGAL